VSLDPHRDKACLNKTRYSTARLAVEAVNRRMKSGKCFVQLYVYFCPYSQDTDPHFHLTKRPQNRRATPLELECERRRNEPDVEIILPSTHRPKENLKPFSEHLNRENLKMT
jgi:hypothetical protein